MKLKMPAAVRLIAIAIALILSVSDPALSSDNFVLGARTFGDKWVPDSVASQRDRSGLGPLFSQDSCDSCHRRGGRMAAATSDGVIRFATLDLGFSSAQSERLFQKRYGSHLTLSAIAPSQPISTAVLKYTPHRVRNPSGPDWVLRKPVVTLPSLPAKSKPADVSLRIPPHLWHMEQIEQIQDQTIRQNADPLDVNNDGISGRVSNVLDLATGASVIGRFGWKASVSSLIEQIAKALSRDMGITSRLFPDNQCAYRTCVVSAVERYEISDLDLYALVHYVRTIPMPPGLEDHVTTNRAGEVLFHAIGCGGCHLQLGRTNLYSDLLLHDLGPDLASSGSENHAKPEEWRTAPLLGIRLLKQQPGQYHLLHDGRARSAMEAVLWHGGEALNSQQAFIKLSGAERNALINFVESL